MDTATARSAARPMVIIEPVERIVLAIIAAVFAACVVLAALNDTATIDGPAYLMLAGLSLALFAAGQFYRVSGRSPNIALALTATALIVAFSNVTSVFNHLLMPIGRPVIDPWLAGVDRAMGFNWPDFVALVGRHPVFNMVIRLAYESILPQILLLVLTLGFLGRRLFLNRLLLIFPVTALPMIGFWALFPSHGAFAVYALSPAAVAEVNPALSPDYAAGLLAMLRGGPGLITPENVKGLIGFPSYHIAMAMICTYCALGSRALFWPLVVVNILVVPGSIVHGGHHLVDLIAGMLLFMAGLWATNRILARL
ncbi:MAG: phosphatase PAP2 family protein [Nitratireductor sp.]|nr:phosphatase PAP2 family protein [Nitratireductor sp.]